MCKWSAVWSRLCCPGRLMIAYSCNLGFGLPPLTNQSYLLDDNVHNVNTPTIAIKSQDPQMIDHTFVIDRRCGDAASFSLSQSQQIDVSASDSNSEAQW